MRAGNFHKVGFHTGILEKKPTTWFFQQEKPPAHPDMEPKDARKLPECVFPVEKQRKNPRHGFFSRKNRPYTQIRNRETPGSFRSVFFQSRSREKTHDMCFLARKFPHIHKNATICCISENLFTTYSNK